MSSLVALICAVCILIPPAVANIFCYPVSIHASRVVSEYIVKVCAHRLFSIFHFLGNVEFIGYKDYINELPKQFFIISNHQSLVDIPVYMNFLRKHDLRFVAKKELGRHIPLVSEMLRAQKHCLIPRSGSPAVAMKTLEKFGRQVVAENQIPVLFPEGTRSRDGKVGTFYAAGFRKLAEITKLPVVVCALDGGWTFGNFRTIITSLRGCYRVKIMKIYPAPKTKADQVKILEEGKALIVKQLEEWRK